jgi:hypothetical protein
VLFSKKKTGKKMISLAALFSFQGTDRPKATRRSPGEPRFETG